MPHRDTVRESLCTRISSIRCRPLSVVTTPLGILGKGGMRCDRIGARHSRHNERVEIDGLRRWLGGTVDGFWGGGQQGLGVMDDRGQRDQRGHRRRLEGYIYTCQEWMYN